MKEREEMKQTFKLLFVNPDTTNIEALNRTIKNLPILVVIEMTEQAYVVDTKIPVEKL